MRKIAKSGYSGEPEDAREVVPRPDDQKALVQHGIKAESEDMIRRMLAEQRREYNLRQLPDITPDTSDAPRPVDPDVTSARAKRRKAWGKALNDVPASHFDVDTDDADPPSPGLFARLCGARSKGQERARTSRVKSWHVILAGLGLLMVFKPLVIPSLFMGVFWGIVLFSLIFGPGRVFEFLKDAWEFFLRRNPALATALRDTSDAIVLGAIALLKRLPGNLDQRWFPQEDEAAVDAEEEEDALETRLPAKVFRG